MEFATAVKIAVNHRCKPYGITDRERIEAQRKEQARKKA